MLTKTEKVCIIISSVLCIVIGVLFHSIYIDSITNNFIKFEANIDSNTKCNSDNCDFITIASDFDIVDSVYDINYNNCVHKSVKLYELYNNLGYYPNHITLFAKNDVDDNHRMLQISFFIDSTSGIVLNKTDFTNKYKELGFKGYIVR